ncbi:MAG: ABC transporter ATP-binding protein [Alphaproteobacteria bacterium]|nr:ABC transporter ATP-binding protein [Alphaproteobacteria bacterium]
MSRQKLLRIDGLSIDLPTDAGTLHAVRGVSFAIGRGETLGLVGESGCGKSLTALSIMNLLPKSASRSADCIELFGEDLRALDEMALAQGYRGQRVSYIFQEPMTSLNPVYSIGHQLTEVMLRHQNTTHEAATDRAVYLLERVGITGAVARLAQYPHQFSGGQRQRILVALALMNEPDLVIADEPTTALDVTIQAQILRLLKELQQEMGMALILISHDLGVISRMCDDVIVMYAGRVVEKGAANDVLRAPQHPYTQGLVRCISVETGELGVQRLETIPGTVPSLIDFHEGCAFSDRCSFATAACEHGIPPTHEMAGTHTYECIHGPSEIAKLTRPETAISQGRTKQVPSAMIETALQLKDITCRFTVRSGIFARRKTLTAVNDVSLILPKGETLALVGESGSGKSTLARILVGIQSADAGEIRLFGRPSTQFDRLEFARRIQPIFQDPYGSLNPRRTIGQIIQKPLMIHGIGDAEIRERRTREVLDAVGLPKRYTNRYASQLSGGQRQRVAIARALALQPEIIVCDEPTSALDVSIQAQILNLLADLRDDFGLTYLFITHDLEVVRHLADQVAVMYFGEIVESGRTAQIFNSPKHPYTRSLLASFMSVAPGAGIPDNRLGTNYPDPLNRPSGCAFHPRCPVAVPQCATSAPEPSTSEDGFVACHLASP